MVTDITEAEKAKRISADRKRTNMLRVPEQAAIAFFCRIMPPFVTPDMLTMLSLVASLIIFYGFYLAKGNPYFFAISIAGFALQWFGDSLDGRIAYYRGIPRKWYGFALDMCMDWASTVLMGLGFFFYLSDEYKIVAFLFIACYAWIMILTLMKYKITGSYSIDSGLLGPTELRIGICLVLLASMFYPQILVFFACFIVAVVTVIDFVEFRNVLKLGDERDRAENEKKARG
ncbi:MAG TPA: CDP-alcohol phosphatidyltransferase family protein [Chitinophagales bacterium]|nr:CDP-alcohol phosphatidyltransferase family protein [Chitinophagales bacterium]